MYNPFPTEAATEECLKLMQSLDLTQRLDFDVPKEQANASFSTKHILDESCGQMFGVLVCENEKGERINLKAFSGQYNSQWEVPGWVSPCFSVDAWKEEVAFSDPKIKALTKKIEGSLVNGLDPAGEKGKELHALRLQRKKLSQESLLRIYKSYNFTCFDKSVITYSNLVNSETELLSIPTGTGECCGPKLLNYAYKNNLKPLSLAEFFYGTEPHSHLKKHKTFYPPCDEKCSVLIPKMIGLSVLYRDDDIIVVNKPCGVLSVPGKGPEKADCISNRVRSLVPNCIEQPAVHRLDMDTSGILVLGLTKEAQRALSIQFQDRKVKKDYRALLRGRLSTDSTLADKTQTEGTIEFSICVDINNRPYQIIDEAKGRISTTNWKLLSEKEEYNPFSKKTEWHSLILFSPQTGRTHQLRVHSANKKGFGIPIIGDRLYGVNYPGERLCLQAFYLQFIHPKTQNLMEFSIPSEF